MGLIFKRLVEIFKIRFEKEKGKVIFFIMAFFQTLIKSISARSKNVIKNILLSVGVKAVNVLCSLVLVPLSLGYLSKEEYGVTYRCLYW